MNLDFPLHFDGRGRTARARGSARCSGPRPRPRTCLPAEFIGGLESRKAGNFHKLSPVGLSSRCDKPSGHHFILKTVMQFVAAPSHDFA